MRRFLAILIVLACGEVFAQDTITRSEVLRIADSYVRHAWKASPKNVFHGADEKGVQIDTPDKEWFGEKGFHVDGTMNVGLPYCWGGESTLEEFDRGIAEGRPAGYIFRKPTTRPPGSTLPIGVDCSGYVSCCWRLTARRSTRDMAKECEQLASFDELRPGDALNDAGSHVVLFKQWLDEGHTKMHVYEATFPKVRESEHSRESMTNRGFVPLRYRWIADN